MDINKGESSSRELTDSPTDSNNSTPMFTIKKWNAVAMWSWDVKSENCAICRIQVMG